MRYPYEDECLDGTVCISDDGGLAVVTGKKHFGIFDAWVGLPLDGRESWVCKQPLVISDSVAEHQAKMPWKNTCDGYVIAHELPPRIPPTAWAPEPPDRNHCWYHSVGSLNQRKEIDSLRSLLCRWLHTSPFGPLTKETMVAVGQLVGE